MVCLIEAKVDTDLKLLVRFVGEYCKCKHADAPKTRIALKRLDVERLAGRPLHLCRSCRQLLEHALTKRANCPMIPKPMCKHCPQHCYHPTYRNAIKEVMKFSGRRLVLRGRLDYLFHLFF